MYKNLFPTAQQVTYLDTAAEGLPLPQCEGAFSQYCRAKARGTPGRQELHAVEAETLGLVARLLGTDAANVAFLSSASEALNRGSRIHWFLCMRLHAIPAKLRKRRDSSIITASIICIT